ncbi:PDGLE domain-containing protein [Nocardioides campestrisoli]|uniref:PDGLE domain-containing protein n=1 Tax=Nocardioides campestrisoli TaxID=2736757 RepID=UPI0015E744CA|nr:PDGLE domain-containing protein [Nocardioides campestrisoli]
MSTEQLDSPRPVRSRRGTRLWLAGLLVSLLVAGGLSYYASSNPDGLEHVAEQTGFLDSADEHAAGDGPLADYQVKGVEDARLSGALAGLLGSGTVLLLAGGIFWVVRRRGSGPDSSRE